ncbi:MAG: tetratricopeptide repeat protein [Nitrospira sp.]|nr:tetratricopeptide repeat protein [Nitrospira sp.]
MRTSCTRALATVMWVLLFAALAGQATCWALSHSATEREGSSTGRLSGHELLRIGEIHDHQHHFLETLTYYQLALSRFREQKQSRGIATALVKIARVHEQQGTLQKAYTCLQEALPLVARSPDRAAHAGTLLVMGRVGARLGHRDEARDALSQALALFKQVKDSRGRSEALIQLGLLQVDEGPVEAGLSSLQQAGHDARARHDTEQQLVALIALGDAHWLLDRMTDARALYSEGLRLAETEHHVPSEAKLRLRLAQIDSADGHLNQGIVLGKRALLLSQTLRDNAAEAVAWSLLADLYHKMEREGEAEEADQRALAIYRGREIKVHGTP